MTTTITTWHRLEPRVRGGDPALGLRAAIHDPLWLLGRQWQMGELLGEDTAFPVSVRLETEESPLTRFRPGDPGSHAVMDYDGRQMPLEAMVEREALVTQTLRLRLDAWTRLRASLVSEQLAETAARLAAAHPLTVMGSDDPSLRRWLALAGAAPVDGLAVAASLRAGPSEVPAEIAGPFLSWVDEQTRTRAGDCWVNERLEYHFAVAASTPDGEVTLAAPEYTGGRLDWYDLDVDNDPAHRLAPPPLDADRAPRVEHLLPTRVTFPGMPAERFWEFEDATVDLGAVSAAAEDLGRLLVVEFATVFGNDWWQIPVPATYGSVIRVRYLSVRDSFGDNYEILPTSEIAAGGTTPWRMFAQTDATLAAGSGPAPPLLLLAPVIADALEGNPVERLLLLRDEMANLAWGVERIVEGADGRPRDRGAEYASRQSAALPPMLGSPADLVYVLQTQVPEHWIPLVPIRDPRQPPEAVGAVMLQRGALLAQDGTRQPVTPQGVLLSRAISPWLVHDEEVPRGGLSIARIPAMARWLGGASHSWVGRRVQPGRGEGSSGLQFDLAVPPAPPLA
jgi:hypothetical protein